MQSKNNLLYQIIKKIPFTEYHVGAIIEGYKRSYHSGMIDVAGMWFNENGVKSFSLTNLTKLIQEGYVQQIQKSDSKGGRTINKIEGTGVRNILRESERTGGEPFELNKYYIRTQEPGDKNGGKKEGEEENTRSRKELKVDMEKGKRMFGSFLMALEKNQADGYNKSDIEVFALWYSMGYGAALISSSKNGLLEAFEEKASFEKLLNEEILN